MEVFLAQLTAAAASAPAYFAFRRALRDPETTQRARLAALLRASATTRAGQARGIDADWSWEKFTERLPSTDYAHWESEIRAQRESPKDPILSAKVARFEPTSGSSAKRKWIPYSSSLLAEFDRAASAWLVDIACSVPAALRGPHYWSLSWLPEELRADKRTTDDSELLSPLKAALFSRIFAVPSSLCRLPRASDAQLVTLAHLAAKSHLTVASVWSPTYLLTLLDELLRRREEVARVLQTGRWPSESIASLVGEAPRNRRVAAMLLESSSVEAEFLRALWPKLALLSAWDSSTSKLWSTRLKKLFPGVRFQGKGLWATEGVVTIPFAEKHPLALTSHVLEFRCLNTDRILPPWRLERGQELQPLLSTGSGLWRYSLADRVRVTDFLERTPSLEFIGRLVGEDLVGEKMDPALALEAMERVRGELGAEVTAFFAVPGSESQKPHYLALVVGGSVRVPSDRIERRIEDILGSSHHYRLARELKQLDPCRIVASDDVLGYYAKHCARKPSVAGDLKLEPLVRWQKVGEGTHDIDAS